MRRLFIIILFCITTLAFGQEMSVKSFYLAETDLTANTPGTMVRDQNGNLCALIKLETTLDGFSFDVGSLGISKTQRVGGEIWIYVPFGVRKITLSHPQLGVIRDYAIPCSIEKGRTYIMTLVAGSVRTIVDHAITKQFLYIELTPKEAILEINGKIRATENGVYQELLAFGKYQYKVYCQDYHDLSGIIEVYDPQDTQTLKLTLKPAFGSISVLATAQKECSGGVVYIDERYIGQIPVNNIKVNSGSHRLKIIKDMYEAYNDVFTISDDEIKVFTPSLIPDFAEVTLRTCEDASIFVNGEIKTKHQWTGKLASGSYIFESRQKGHIPYKQSYDISRKNQGAIIDIPGPTPIYGGLIISSTPSKAKISIDGEYIGESPKYISRHIVGEYKVTAILNGYKPQTKTVNITEGAEVSLQFTLEEQNREDTSSSLSMSSETESIPFQLVEEKPSFQGGDANQFSKWVTSNLVYPETAKNNGVQGRVTLQFTIMPDGTVDRVRVLRGVDPALDKEAVRVVSMSPKWKPGKQRNRAVPVTYTFPVIFQLRNSTSNKL